MSEPIDHDRATPGNAFDPELSTVEDAPTTETVEIVAPPRITPGHCGHTREEHAAMARAKAIEVVDLAARYMGEDSAAKAYPAWLLEAVKGWTARDVSVAAQLAVGLVRMVRHDLGVYIAHLDEMGYVPMSEVLMALDLGLTELPIMRDIVADTIRNSDDESVAALIGMIAACAATAGLSPDEVRGIRAEWEG